MRNRGTRIFDQVLWTSQIQWLVVPLGECPDEDAERRIICRHFRLPHGPWGPDRAFVEPVLIRRTRRRVLFRQESGLGL
jgi:hypothetical protein